MTQLFRSRSKERIKRLLYNIVNIVDQLHFSGLIEVFLETYLFADKECDSNKFVIAVE